MDPTLTALEAIEDGIKSLQKPTDRVTVVGPLTEPPLKHRVGTWTTYRDSEVLLEVTEDLIGAAFVVAQTYIKAEVKKAKAKKGKAEDKKPETLARIEAVANYWKHRDQWDSAWTPPEKGPGVATISKVREMGEAPPVVPGQLTKLAEIALGAQFSANALWTALTA